MSARRNRPRTSIATKDRSWTTMDFHDVTTQRFISRPVQSNHFGNDISWTTMSEFGHQSSWISIAEMIGFYSISLKCSVLTSWIFMNVHQWQWPFRLGSIQIYLLEKCYCVYNLYQVNFFASDFAVRQTGSPTDRQTDRQALMHKEACWLETIFQSVVTSHICQAKIYL